MVTPTFRTPLSPPPSPLPSFDGSWPSSPATSTVPTPAAAAVNQVAKEVLAQQQPANPPPLTPGKGALIVYAPPSAQINAKVGPQKLELELDNGKKFTVEMDLPSLSEEEMVIIQHTIKEHILKHLHSNPGDVFMLSLSDTGWEAQKQPASPQQPAAEEIPPQTYAYPSVEHNTQQLLIELAGDRSTIQNRLKIIHDATSQTSPKDTKLDPVSATTFTLDGGDNVCFLNALVQTLLKREEFYTAVNAALNANQSRKAQHPTQQETQDGKALQKLKEYLDKIRTPQMISANETNELRDVIRLFELSPEDKKIFSKSKLTQEDPHEAMMLLFEGVRRNLPQDSFPGNALFPKGFACLEHIDDALTETAASESSSQSIGIACRVDMLALSPTAGANSVSAQDCVNHFFRKDLFPSDSTTPPRKRTRQYKLTQAPDTLVLSFRYFNADRTKLLNRSLEKAENISLPQDSIIDSKPGDAFEYEAVGCIFHTGDKLNSGHFTASIKENGKLVHWNDSKPANKTSNLITAVPDKSSKDTVPYIIVYQRKKTAPEPGSSPQQTGSKRKERRPPPLSIPTSPKGSPAPTSSPSTTLSSLPPLPISP